jgi:hypothetical protein
MSKKEFKDWEEEYKYYEEKYYPITWEINDGQIEIRCKKGKLLPLNHKIYGIEESFIQDQIDKYDHFDGEICSI